MLLEINSLHIKGSFIFCVVCNYSHLCFPGKPKTSQPRLAPEMLENVNHFFQTQFIKEQLALEHVITVLPVVCPLQGARGTTANDLSSAWKNLPTLSFTV